MKTTTQFGFRHLIFTLGLLVAISASAADVTQPLPTMKEGIWDTLKMTWNQADPVNTAAGTPIGNGHIGAKIKGGVDVETLELNDKTFWSGGPGLDPENPTRKTALEETRRLLAAGDIPGAEQAAQGMWGSGDLFAIG